MDGLLVVDKPTGWTSFDVVAKLRRITRTRSIGHTGTLDPSATGVLVLCLGKATRLVEYLVVHRKTYEAVIRFGCTTTTDDADGDVLTRAAYDGLTAERIMTALAGFVGKIMQKPPAISAVRVDGVRSYALARAGTAPELQPRQIEIGSVLVRGWDPPDLRVTVECGPGTYIRSLARDLGDSLGSAAHLASLRRTRVGNLTIEDALPLAEFLGDEGPALVERRLIPMNDALEGWQRVSLSTTDVISVRQGKKLWNDETTEACATRAAGVDERGTLVAILERLDGYWQPRKVFG